jgi:mRNA interferase MazF
MEVKQAEVVLCEFYFSDLKSSKKRPVLVFKDNLPYDDFVAVPISGKIENLKNDEFLIDGSDFCEGGLPKKSKYIIRKTFVVSKSVVLKKYGTVSRNSYLSIRKNFCNYFCRSD